MWSTKPSNMRYHVQEALKMSGKNNTKLRRLVVMAAKCENTKPSYKTRAIWSADSVTREVTGTYDKTAIPLPSLYSRASTKKDSNQVTSLINEINSNLIKHRNTVIMCNDASGWSDKDPELYGQLTMITFIKQRQLRHH